MATPAPALTPEPLPPPTGLMHLFSSLRYRDWRYLWSGLMVAQTGEWMDSIAINWLVLVQTNSPLILGSVNLVRGLPSIVFALAGGVVADRFDRRALMIWTQVGNFACTATLAALATTGMLELWHIYTLLVLRGTVTAFNSPARASIVGDLVPRSDVSNAIALHSAMFNSTRMIGPAIGGFLVAASGSGFVLWIHATSITVAIATVVAMAPPLGRRRRRRPQPGDRWWMGFNTFGGSRRS